MLRCRVRTQVFMRSGRPLSLSERLQCGGLSPGKNGKKLQLEAVHGVMCLQLPSHWWKGRLFCFSSLLFLFDFFVSFEGAFFQGARDPTQSMHCH